METEYSNMPVPRTASPVPAFAAAKACSGLLRTRLGQAMDAVGKWVILRRFLLFSGLFPFAIRTIPEILAGPWPLGFDTVWTYAPFVKQVETQGAGSAMDGVLGQHTAP